MTFSLSLTPEPFNSPPRVLLEATESDSGKPLQSCRFFRDGVALRFSASLAGQSAIAYDYDAPFDVSLDYRADATELASLATAWSDTFTDLSAWSGPGGSPSNWTATGGKAQATTETAVMNRGTGSDPIVKVSGTNPAFAGSATSGLFAFNVTNDADQIVASLTFSISGQTIILAADSVTSVTGVAPTSFDLVFSESTVTASGSGWSLTVPCHSDYPLSGVTLQVSGTFTGTRTVTLDDLTVYTPVMPAVLDEVTDSETTSLLGVTSAWLTNAAQPDVAVEVTPDGSSADGLVFTPETRKATNAAASSVQLDIEGSADVMTVTTGPRKRKTWSMELICLSADALAAIEDVLANSAVVSLRRPESLAYMNLDDGFYAVGDVDTDRIQAPWENRDEIDKIVLPLTPSRAPAFDVLWSWNYNALAQTGLTYDQAAALFPTYTDLLLGPS